MVRLFKSLLVVMIVAIATFLPTYVNAQSTGPSPLPTPTPTNTSGTSVTGTSTPIATRQSATPQNGGSATIGSVLPQAGTVTATATVSPQTGSEDDALPTAVVTGTPAVSVTATVTETTVTTPTVEATPGPLEGTILANRSESVARFFVEGQTFQLTAGRSQGLDLPRATTVLNLFNCDGELEVDTPGCFWDPYLIQQDGFYEIYNAATAGEEPTLMLREAGVPPTGQVWVQNRTGQTESVVFKEEVHEIQPTSVIELPVSTGVPAILYVRSCLTIDNQSACEWAPRSLDAGVYYAMLEVDTPGTQTGSTMTSIDLRPIVGEGEEAATAEVSEELPTIVCSVVVPALNIRSGPGLQYDIIGKVRTTDGSAGTVGVTGRSADNEWLTVEPSAAEGGWINNSPSFITCSSDVMTLPVVEAPAPPTPQPGMTTLPPVVGDTTVPQAAQTVETPALGTGEATVEATEALTTSAPTVPDGQALLIINNGFQHEMRFTLDQMYRPQQGPSEFDLQPGQSLSIVVYPGNIPFTASTPWSGLSSNATLTVGANQSLTLWLRFEPEPGGNWVFRFN